MVGLLGCFGVVIGIAALFMGEIGVALLCIIVGVIFIFAAKSTEKDDQKRHKNDYGKVARCYKCGSTKVYIMTYDDKRDSISFWGSASSKIGKRYHCDNCGNEW